LSADAASAFACAGVGCLIWPDSTLLASDATFLEVWSFFDICIDSFTLDGVSRHVIVPTDEFRRGITGGSVYALDLPRSGVLNRCYIGGGGMVSSVRVKKLWSVRGWNPAARDYQGPAGHQTRPTPAVQRPSAFTRRGPFSFGQPTSCSCDGHRFYTLEKLRFGHFSGPIQIDTEKVGTSVIFDCTETDQTVYVTNESLKPALFPAQDLARIC